jgi:hypothetical protein
MRRRVTQAARAALRMGVQSSGEAAQGVCAQKVRKSASSNAPRSLATLFDRGAARCPRNCIPAPTSPRRRWRARRGGRAGGCGASRRAEMATPLRVSFRDDDAHPPATSPWSDDDFRAFLVRARWRACADGLTLR